MRILIGVNLLLGASLTAAVAGATMQAAAPEPVPAEVTPARILAGSELFNGRTCVFCHAVAGRGAGPNGPDLSDSAWLHGSGDVEGIHRIIMWGVEADEMRAEPRYRFEMNPEGGQNLSQEDLAALSAYVWALSRPTTSAFVADQIRFVDLVRAGQVGEAAALFRARHSATPNAPLVPAGGLARFARTLQPANALALMRFATELHPDSAPISNALGAALQASGDNAGAATAYRRTLTLDPSNEEARRRLDALPTQS